MPVLTSLADLETVTIYRNLFSPAGHEGQLAFFFRLGIFLIVLSILAGIRLILLGWSEQPRKRSEWFQGINRSGIFSTLPVLIVCLLTLSVESVHYMEASYIKNYPETSLKMVILEGALNNHFPLYGTFLKLMSMFSMRVEWYRSFSALFLAGAVLQFSRLLNFSGYSRMIAIILFGLSPFSLYYGRTTEPYSLCLLLFTSFLYYQRRNLQFPGSARWASAITAILSAYTEQFLFIAILIVTFFTALRMRREDRKLHFTTVGVLLVACSPMLLFEIMQIPLKEIIVRPQAGIYLSPTMPSFAQAGLDLLRVLGLQFHSLGKSGVAATGAVVLALMLLAALQIRRFTRHLPLASIAVVFTAFLLLAGYYTVFTGWISGYYPLLRHIIFVQPIVFLALFWLLKNRIRNDLKRNLLISAVLFFQAVSAVKILTVPTVPESREAWRNIRSEVRDGDAFAATPAGLFMFSSIGYHFLPPAIDKPDPYWAKTPEGALILSRYNDALASFHDMKKILFIKRIWNIRYHFRAFGLFEEMGMAGERQFDQEFSDFPVVSRRKISDFLSVELREVPEREKFSGNKFRITAGRNDLPFLRNLQPSEYKFARSRRITATTEMMLPLSEHPPKTVLFRWGVNEKKLDLSGELVPGKTDRGWLVSLGSLRGTRFDAMEIFY